jgi:hypothetical protein
MKGVIKTVLVVVLGSWSPGLLISSEHNCIALNIPISLNHIHFFMPTFVRHTDPSPTLVNPGRKKQQYNLKEKKQYNENEEKLVSSLQKHSSADKLEWEGYSDTGQDEEPNKRDNSD